MLYEKIFCIGFWKQGTSSLHKLFLDNNLKSIHDSCIDYVDILDKYDCFTDNNCLIRDYKKYYNLYPNSLFILNTRPLKKWLLSAYKHIYILKDKNDKCNKLWPPTESQIKNMIVTRENHYKSVLDFFKDKSNNLIVINIEEPGWQNIVLNKLNLKCTANNLIMNKNKHQIDKDILELIELTINNVLSEHNNPYELLLPNYSINNYEYVNNILTRKKK